jgi:uncharacterized membrane protein YfcA
MDPTLGIVAFGIGICVGLTGMGGGALMTPVLVFFFNVPPLAAVSSDLVSSAVMKPVGSLVHLRYKTSNLHIVGWLIVGSVPAAFGGVLILKLLGPQEAQRFIRVFLGGALVLSAVLLVVRAYLRLLEHARARTGAGPPLPRGKPDIVVSPLPTVLLGAVGGLLVGLTSVGSGSIIILGLMMLYPGLRASQLVGTDLAQAVPLVVAAALGHVFFGDLHTSIAVPLIVGSVPGVIIGARLSSLLAGGIIRRALAFVLLASGLKMLGLATPTAGIILLATLIVAPALWMIARHRFGLHPLASRQRRIDLANSSSQAARPEPAPDSGAPESRASPGGDP